MKLYILKPDDRDMVLMLLGRNGYTVRQGKEKDPKSGKTVSVVEVVENAEKH